MNKIRIEVLGTSYMISSKESEAYVQSLVKEMDAQIRKIVAQSPKLSFNAALVLYALDCTDSFKKSEQSSDHMRAQLTEYLEEAAKARIGLDDANREIERLRRELALLRAQRA
jgi:cell division protein ZapA